MRHTSYTNRLVTLLCSATLLAACARVSEPAPPAAGATAAIPGQYIVALARPELNAQAQTTTQGSLEPTAVAASLGVQNVQTLAVIHGFVAAGVDEAALARLEADPRVRYAEPDRVVKLSETQPNFKAKLKLRAERAGVSTASTSGVCR